MRYEKQETLTVLSRALRDRKKINKIIILIIKIIIIEDRELTM